jgi:hypothetical protein
VSNYLAVATVTAVLGEKILKPAVQSIVDETEVTTERPDTPANGDASPRVNLFLYQVVPNAAWRNADLPTRRSDGRLVQRPQAALDLYYLLTFYGNEAKLQPQRFLGKTISTLHAHPLLTREAIRAFKQESQDATHKFSFLKDSDLAEQIEMVKLSPLSLDLEELSKLWSVFFQTPYALSVAYQASVVLIEAEETPQAALPVRAPKLYVEPFHQPVIDRVIAKEGADQPIVTGTTLVIQGQRLQGDVTQVRIAGAKVASASVDVSDTRISVPLATLPDGVLRAGVQGVQVVHPMMMGDPAKLHRGVESNVASFVLHPTIEATVVPAEKKVTVTFTPEVGRNQRVVFLLNEFDPPPPDERAPYAYSFKARRDNGIDEPDVDRTKSIAFATKDVKPEEYLVRVQVDGAESPLTPDTDPDSETFNQYIGPKVTIS